MTHPLALLLALALSAGVAHADGGGAPEVAVATDLGVEIVSLQPPSGSTLRVGQPVVVKLRYRYTQPGEDVMVWAKLLEPGLQSTYQGAPRDTPPGNGVVERFVTLDDPGSATRLTVVAKNGRYQQVFAKDFPVNYTWVPNPRVEAARGDGAGARVVDVHFAPGSPAVLKVGTKVDVQLDIDGASARGLQPWVEPITTCNMTYDGMVVLTPAQGRVHKTFTVGEKCVVTKLKVAIKNTANAEVFSEVVDVDFRYVD